MSKSKELISIIMSAYNAEDTIERAIKSILNQSYKNIELIIINDNSTDGTLKIIEGFISDKVRVIDSSINSGTYYNRNYGITISKGRYLTFHDADDWCDPNHIQVLYENYNKFVDTNYWKGSILNASHNKIKIVYAGGSRWTREKGVYVKTRDGKALDPNYGAGPYKGKTVVLKASVTAFFEKSLINEVGYFHTSRFGADSEFEERVAVLYGTQEYKLPAERITYNVYDRPGSLTRSSDSGHNTRAREIYKYCFRKWHKELKATRDVLRPDYHYLLRPYVEFPPQRHAFPVPDKDGIIMSANTSIECFQEIFSNNPDKGGALDISHKPVKISVIMQSFLEDYPGARSKPEEKFVRAVYSMINQTNSNWELIIISDGCKKTRDLYEQHFKNYDNIKFEMTADPAAPDMQEDHDEVKYRIPGSPRGRGVEMASGDWICYLDADDIFRKDAIKKITEILLDIRRSKYDIRWIMNKARVENACWALDSSMYYAEDEHRIDGLASKWKNVFLKGDNISSSCSMLIHKKGYPKHKWGDEGEYETARDTLFVRGIIRDSTQMKYGKMIELPYYIRCHTRPKDVTLKGWDY